MKVLGSSGALLSQASWNTSIHVQYLEFSLEWETSFWLSVCLQVCLLRLQTEVSFTAVCIELWEQCICRQGRESEISVSVVYCTFGSLGWSLWKQKVRKQVNLSFWDQAISPVWKGIREVGFLRKATGWGLRASRQSLTFFSEHTEITVFKNINNKAAEMLLCLRFFLASTCWNLVKHFFSSNSIQLCCIYLQSFSYTKLFLMEIGNITALWVMCTLNLLCLLELSKMQLKENFLTSGAKCLCRYQQSVFRFMHCQTSWCIDYTLKI